MAFPREKPRKPFAYSAAVGIEAVKKALQRHTFDGDRFGVRPDPNPKSRAARQLEAKKDKRPTLRAGRAVHNYTQNKRELALQEMVRISQEAGLYDQPSNEVTVSGEAEIRTE